MVIIAIPVNQNSTGSWFQLSIRNAEDFARGCGLDDLSIGF